MVSHASFPRQFWQISGQEVWLAAKLENLLLQGFYKTPLYNSQESALHITPVSSLGLLRCVPCSSRLILIRELIL